MCCAPLTPIVAKIEIKITDLLVNNYKVAVGTQIVRLPDLELYRDTFSLDQSLRPGHF